MIDPDTEKTENTAIMHALKRINDRIDGIEIMIDGIIEVAIRQQKHIELLDRTIKCQKTK